jgi:UDP-N-acetylmuramate dehydrogenase
MREHTTFRVGGTVDFYVKPPAAAFSETAAAVFRFAQKAALEVFILGGGSNIVPGDKGIRGIVLDTTLWSGFEAAGSTATVRAGTASDAAANAAAVAGLSGLDFLAGLPGSIGGALYMNARCFEKSISDVLLEAETLDETGKCQWRSCRAEEFGYKKSPFQNRKTLILRARFALEKGQPRLIQEKMAAYRAEREKKGHYRAPSAGSVFKNNRDFGKPTGKIIEELGLCGTQIGGAQIAPWHGNFIINTGGARAKDIRALVDLCRNTARARLGIELESEILFIGEND